MLLGTTKKFKIALEKIFVRLFILYNGKVY